MAAHADPVMLRFVVQKSPALRLYSNWDLRLGLARQVAAGVAFMHEKVRACHLALTATTLYTAPLSAL